MEEKLISQYKENNILNIEQIVIEYSKYVYKAIQNMANNLSSEDIQEIAGDVFLVVWINREKLKEEKMIKPYLLGTTKNLVRNKYRTISSEYNLDEYEKTIIDSNDTELCIEQKEKNKIIASVLNNIKKEDKDIFTLFYYSSKSIKEIAKRLNMTEVNVKTKLHRTRTKIKQVLMKGGYSYGK